MLARQETDALSHIQDINTDDLDPATISALIDSTNCTLDALTRKQGKNPSLLESAQTNKNQALLDDYYQQAVNYFKSNITKDIDTSMFENEVNRRTILFWAISCFQSAEIIEDLISKGSQVSEAYYDDDNFLELPAFSIAITLGNCAAIRVLLAHDAALVVQKINIFGYSAAHYAASQENLAVLEELFKASKLITRIEAGPLKLTPLHAAAKLGRHLAAKWLLGHDQTTCDLRDDKGYTALHYASQEGHSEIVELLLDNDADMHLVTEATSKHGPKSALQLAAESRRSDVVYLLLQHQAQLDTETEINYLEILKRLQDERIRIDYSNLSEDLQVVFQLIDYSIDRDKKPEYNRSLFGYPNPTAWPKTTKLGAAAKIITNIITFQDNPLFNLTNEEIKSLKEGTIKPIVANLLETHLPKSGKSSPNSSEDSSPASVRSSPHRQ